LVTLLRVHAGACLQLSAKPGATGRSRFVSLRATIILICTLRGRFSDFFCLFGPLASIYKCDRFYRSSSTNIPYFPIQRHGGHAPLPLRQTRPATTERQRGEQRGELSTLRTTPLLPDRNRPKGTSCPMSSPDTGVKWMGRLISPLAGLPNPAVARETEGIRLAP